MMNNAEQCLIPMIEKWRRALDVGDHARALLNDLSKAFECIDHELLPGLDSPCTFYPLISTINNKE